MNKNRYDFTKKGIEEMYENVCKECQNLSSDIIDGDKSWNEFDKLLITISIGKHVIKVPNNADYLDTIFQSIEDCLKEG